MKAKASKRTVEPFDVIKRAAAANIRAGPGSHPVIMQESVARTEAYQLAFHTRNPWRDGFSEEDRDELSDLMAWNRR